MGLCRTSDGAPPAATGLRRGQRRRAACRCQPSLALRLPLPAFASVPPAVVAYTGALAAIADLRSLCPLHELRGEEQEGHFW
ncbi:hypothetical protein ACP4OV_001918 [Aristida adscensionis]